MNSREPITYEFFKKYNLDSERIGVTRELSMGSERVARKKNMIYVGIGFTDGGSIFAKPLMQPIQGRYC